SCSAVTAEALKIITAPSRQSPSVTTNSQRSFSRRLGIAFPRTHPIRVRTKLFTLLEMADEFLKHATAVFVILKLVKARTSRRQQHRVPGVRRVKGTVHGAFQRSSALDRHAALDFLFDFVGRGANQ